MSAGLDDRQLTERLPRRLSALRQLARLAEGRLDPAVVAEARRVLERAGGRLALSGGHTVVALAGATGTGKSSLFNALAERALAQVGPRRPTTARTAAAVWGDRLDAAGPLLDWLEVGERHLITPAGRPASVDGLVLLDLPDNDSREEHHRLEVDRLVERVDLLVWVTDPEKYADAVLHERYLRPLARHAAVTLVVLNQADRLAAAPDSGTQEVVADLRRLLETDGLGEARLLVTSARTGEGIEELRETLAEAVRSNAARARRIAADIAMVASAAEACLADARAGQVPAEQRAALVTALERAAGVPVVADAVRRTYRARAKQATGWPFTRWIGRLRPDPLRRLHLDAGSSASARTSLPPPTPAARAEVATAVRRVTSAAVAALPARWQNTVRDRRASEDADLIEALDAAVGRGAAAGGAGMRRPPGWWGAVGALQWLLALTTVLGAGWLLAAAALDWLRLPPLALPKAGAVPVPTALLLGGAVAGLLVAALARALAGVGAGRRARRVSAHLRAEIERVAAESVIDPLEREALVLRQLRDAVERARAG